MWPAVVFSADFQYTADFNGVDSEDSSCARRNAECRFVFGRHDHYIAPAYAGHVPDGTGPWHAEPFCAQVRERFGNDPKKWF
jgi:hypothetical protein